VTGRGPVACECRPAVAIRLRPPSLALLGSLTLACTNQDVPVAAGVELDRMQGHWWEIARIPRDYDRTCHDTTADYRLLVPGTLELHHRCLLGSASGKPSEFVAPATVDDPSVPAKLTLDLGLYRGSYWVLEVGQDYEYALIGHPSLTMLWVLARTPSLPAATLAHLRDTASRDGYDPNALETTPQSDAP
jgi:apolipoprotein D and lipocalin family protein